MKLCAVLLLLLLLTGAAGQERPQPANGTIFGVVVDRARNRVPRIGLTATPLGVALGTVLPHTKANDQGEYRFEKVPWWGRYTVYADDEEAGFSAFSTGPAGIAEPPQVEITPQHPEAEFNVQLPPKAGFLRINLVDNETGSRISDLQVKLMSAEYPDRLIFSESCDSARTILIPPARPLLLHVTSTGYREWDERIGKGKPIFLSSGARVTIQVRLAPLN